MPEQKKRSWVEFLNSLKLIKSPPKKYLNMTEFAEMCGTVKQTVQKAAETGLIDRRFCVATPDRNGGRVLRIDWDAGGYAYISGRKRQFWPEDFSLNDEKTYRPIGGRSIKGTKTLAVETTEDTLAVIGGEPVKLAPMIDLTSAKLRNEQLKALQTEAAVKLANNETIRVQDAADIAKELGLELKAATLLFINKAASKVAAESDVVRCRKILEEHLIDVLSQIDALGENNG